MLQRTAPACDSTLSSLYAADAVPSPTPGPGPVGVYIIDEQVLFRRGLAAMLADHPGYHWVGEADSAAQALLVAHLVCPDVVFVDLLAPDADGVTAMAALRPFWPAARFVLMAGRCEPATLRRVVATGASCLLKSVSALDLADALRAVSRGQQVLAPAVIAALEPAEPDESQAHDLTPREHALLRLMAQGLDNRSISMLMDISVPTVKFHVTNIMAKLRAANRTAAVLTALREKIVRLDDTASTAG
jgi:DNA-binding NarL/FixJ family response regulator